MATVQAAVSAESVLEVGQADQPPTSNRLFPSTRKLVGGLGRMSLAVSRWILDAIGWLFGLASLIVGLALLAAAPILQFFALGYLLEASGRIAQSGRLRDGFPNVRLAGRIGALFLGVALVSLPIWYTNDALADSRLIDPASSPTRLLRATFPCPWDPDTRPCVVGRGSRRSLALLLPADQQLSLGHS